MGSAFSFILFQAYRDGRTYSSYYLARHGNGDLGYWWASYNPVKHWPIVAVGFLGKIFGPIGFVMNYVQGILPVAFGYTLITNDLIW